MFLINTTKLLVYIILDESEARKHLGCDPKFNNNNRYANKGNYHNVDIPA